MTNPCRPETEGDARPATEDECRVLSRVPGFGSVALSIFPDPATGQYKDLGWQALGAELWALLSATAGRKSWL